MTTQSPTPIHEAVREDYAGRITSNASCCGGTSDCCSTDSNLYPADLLAPLPEGESPVSYGCGDPITLASLQPGQTVLDLGSGAGLDCFFASKKVGETGHVIGVDMTPEMLERARSSAKRLNITNVEFRQGFLEDLPVECVSVQHALTARCCGHVIDPSGDEYSRLSRHDHERRRGRSAASACVT